MILAIHHRKGSFSDCRIDYCEENEIEYKFVDAYATDIIQQVEGCDTFMWHFHHLFNPQYWMVENIIKQWGGK